MKHTQDAIENDIGDLIPHGLKKDIAAHTGTYPSIMYAWLNGDDERKSPIFQTLFIMDALDTLEPQIAEAVWQKICAYRDAGRPHDFGSSDPVASLVKTIKKYGISINKCVDALADGQVTSEEAEALLSDLGSIERNAAKLRSELNTHLANLYGKTRDAAEAVN